MLACVCSSPRVSYDEYEIREGASRSVLSCPPLCLSPRRKVGHQPRGQPNRQDGAQQGLVDGDIDPACLPMGSWGPAESGNNMPTAPPPPGRGLLMARMTASHSEASHRIPSLPCHSPRRVDRPACGFLRARDLARLTNAGQRDAVATNTVPCQGSSFMGLFGRAAGICRAPSLPHASGDRPATIAKRCIYCRAWPPPAVVDDGHCELAL